ncbi:MAG TPA: carboxymuconolactone decarboxylase family protein [Gaiellaceae bacterium]|nr:carboxymuconolactone decarboxylase family protein [Gaiellaceae bacterium]
MTTTEHTTTRRRLEFARTLPRAYTALDDLWSAAVDGLERSLVDLVCLRTAQLNGCPYCLDMHSKDALHHGETGERLFQLGAWREADCFTERERAALALTDAVTLVRESRVGDETWAAAAAAFDEPELASLLAAIISSNSWNRLLISIREPAGSYRPD